MRGKVGRWEVDRWAGDERERRWRWWWRAGGGEWWMVVVCAVGGLAGWWWGIWVIQECGAVAIGVVEDAGGEVHGRLGGWWMDGMDGADGGESGGDEVCGE